MTGMSITVTDTIQVRQDLFRVEQYNQQAFKSCF
jgi:hypothetical protein